MVTFSAHGGRNEFLSAGTLKLLKWEEEEAKEQAGLLAEPVITGTKRAGGSSMERRAHSEYGGSYGLYLERLHSCVVIELN